LRCASIVLGTRCGIFSSGAGRKLGNPIVRATDTLIQALQGFASRKKLLRAGDEIRHCILPIDGDRREGNVGPDQWCNKVCGGLQSEHSVSGRPRQNNRLRRRGARSGGNDRYREDWGRVGCNRVGAGYQRRRKRRGTISSLALVEINSANVGNRFPRGREGKLSPLAVQPYQKLLSATAPVFFSVTV
jgi:hypothetical protein